MILLTALVWTFVVVCSAAAATPKPWMWTPAQASASLLAQQDVIYPTSTGAWLPGGKFTTSRCVGVGRPLAKGRWTKFRCATVYQGRGIASEPESHTVWLKVRRFEKGDACLGFDLLASVPSGCLALNGARSGDRDDARVVLAKYLQEKLVLPFPYQGPVGCQGHGAGFYRCWYGGNEPDDRVGLASVTLTVPPKVVETRALR